MRSICSCAVTVFLLTVALCQLSVTAFLLPASNEIFRGQLRGSDSTRLRNGRALEMMAAKKKKAPPASRRGFGAAPALPKDVKIISDAKTKALMAWLEEGGASVSKVGVADFNGLRGVTALQTIAEGEDIVSVPQDLALNLGSEGVNPGYAAIQLVRIEKDEERRAAGWYQAFLDILPPYEDCDTTDFFSKEELAAVEWSCVQEETEERLSLLRQTYEGSQGQVSAGFSAAGKISWEEFLWGVYQVVSRVLSIYTAEDGGQKFLIPMIDLFNHDPASPHSLKCTQGQFKIVAGKAIRPGQQIMFPYGGGKLNNDRILQDYGFVEGSCPQDVEQLLGPRSDTPLPGKPFKGMGCDLAALDELLSSFSTTLEEDEALLASGELPRRMQLAVGFRAEKKRAIAAARLQLGA